MVLIDDNTLVFASGTYIHYFDIPKREVTFQKSVFGCGIGFITVTLHMILNEIEQKIKFFGFTLRKTTTKISKAY